MIGASARIVKPRRVDGVAIGVISGGVLALLDAAIVLGFPALAVWAARRRRLVLAAAAAILVVWILMLAVSAIKLGPGPTLPPGFARAAFYSLLLVTVIAGLPVLATSASVRVVDGRWHRAWVSYLIGAGAALLGVLVGTGLAVRLFQAIA